MEETFAAYQRAIKYNSSSIEVREEYMYLLLTAHSWEKLVEASNDALIYFPLEPIFSFYLGSAHVKLEDHSSAVKAFKGGLAVVYENPELGGGLASQLAMSYRELGQLEKSYDAFEESLAYLDDAYVMNNYAYFLATDRVDIQRALELSTKANEQQIDEPNFLDTHALILYLLDRNYEALVHIQRAQELLGEEAPDAVFSEREGDILWELGQFDLAKAKWHEAVEAGGGKKRLNEKLSKSTP
jgi:tetratricopeptide (TPR) repeat protein